MFTKTLRHRISLQTVIALASIALIAPLRSGAQSVPDPNSTVRIGWLASVQTLDPHRNNITMLSHTMPFYDRLTTIDVTGQKILPMLATAWLFSKDGKTLTLTLRKNGFTSASS